MRTEYPRRDVLPWGDTIHLRLRHLVQDWIRFEQATMIRVCCALVELSILCIIIQHSIPTCALLRYCHIPGPQPLHIIVSCASVIPPTLSRPCYIVIIHCITIAALFIIRCVRIQCQCCHKIFTSIVLSSQEHWAAKSSSQSSVWPQKPHSPKHGAKIWDTLRARSRNHGENGEEAKGGFPHCKLACEYTYLSIYHPVTAAQQIGTVELPQQKRAGAPLPGLHTTL